MFGSRRSPSLLVAAGVCLLLLAFSAAEGAASKQRSDAPSKDSLTPETVPLIASYAIDAELDVQARTVVGSATIRFKNPSKKPTSHLFFHLYLNAFEGSETLFLRAKASRSGQRSGTPGRIVVHSLTSQAFGKANIWPKDAHSPGDKHDRTDIKVPLPRPLRGHEEVELHVDFTSYLPEVVERTGYERDFFLIAHWFPKLAKRESDGRWMHFPFHPQGEFYADFGDYDVSLEVPAEYVVGSTGQLTRLPPTNSGVNRYRAHAKGVHDFAWTAWPDFVEEKRSLHGVAVTVLRPPHTPRVAIATWDTVSRGLVHLGAAYGRYPYPTLTVVVPPTFATRAGGMEYPTFITTGGSEPVSLLGLKDVQLLTIHELAHQWFQGMLASNEMAHPFLDEGITSYAETRYLDETFGAGSLLDTPWISVSRVAGSRYLNMRYPGKQPIASSATEFDSFRSIGSLVYARSALALETLGRIYGEAKLHRALALYSEQFRFRHPRPKDFFGTIGSVLGKRAQEQTERMFEEHGWIDYSVSAVVTRPSKRGFTSSVSIARTGSLDFPVTVCVRFSDDTERTFSLPMGKREHTFLLDHQSKIRWAEVDPERDVLIDENFENNRKAPRDVVPDRDQQFQSALAAFSWALSWMTP